MFDLSYITDTTPVIFILVLLFVWPNENIFKGLEYANIIISKKLS